MAIYMYGQLLANLGFEIYGTIEISKSASSVLVARITSLRLVLSIITFIIILIASYFCKTTIQMLLIYQSLSILLVPLYLQFVARGLTDMSIIGMSKFIQSLLFLVFIYLFVGKNAVHVVPIMWFLSTFISILPLVYYTVKRIPGSFLITSVSAIKGTIKDSFSWGISNALLSIHLNFSTLVLGLYTSGHDVGIFTVAFKIYYFGYTMVSLFYSAFLPHMSKIFDKQYLSVVKNYVRILLIASVATALCGYMFPDETILFVFGNDYSSAIPITRILLIALAVACVNYAFINPLQAMRKNNIYNQFLILRLGTFLCLSFILVPKYNALGAASAMLCAECILVLFSGYQYQKTFRRNPIDV
jgi:O-antigen/teichoic acid export membrane protein